jgi:hypothetical protein
MTKTKRKPQTPVRSTRLVRRRVYRGWINPATELPKKASERSEIVFGSTKWFPIAVRCTITVEYSPNHS